MSTNQTPAETTESTPAACATPKANGKTILFVEDMALFRESVALAVRAVGYQVVIAGDGNRAVSLLDSVSPDLLLLDLGIPGIDGISVLRQIRASDKHKHLPVIVLTSSANREFVMHARELGVQDYILKSQCTITFLLQRISRFCLKQTAAA
jgi:DNA-binding response OmpR family regulator